jgi:geranylgeranyl diphosphate synthase, type I
MLSKTLSMLRMKGCAMSGPSTIIDDVARHAAARAQVPAPVHRSLDRRAAPQPTLDDSLQRALAATHHTLHDYLAHASRPAGDAGPQVVDLWTDLGRQPEGKLVRPRLVLAAYLGLGGQDLGAVVPVAAAQELLHTAMLAHDDLLDHDEHRRGRPNLAGTARARLADAGVAGPRADVHVQAAALLGGDLAIAGAFDLVLTSTADPRVRLEVIGQLVRAVHVAVAGEALDVAGPLRPPLDTDPRLVAELKTATYTCVVPLVSGAILAGADAVTKARLEVCGRALGIAFQLVDDLLGVFGDPRITGKSAVSDLREGKRTLLLASAYRDAGPADVALLDQHVGRDDLDEDGAAVVRDVMRRSGAPEVVRTTVSELLTEARATAQDLPDALGQHLVDLADSFARRVA